MYVLNASIDVVNILLSSDAELIGGIRFLILFKELVTFEILVPKFVKFAFTLF